MDPEARQEALRMHRERLRQMLEAFERERTGHGASSAAEASAGVQPSPRLTADHPSREFVRQMREHIIDTFVPLPRP
jgi:hypothetical protein